MKTSKGLIVVGALVLGISTAYAGPPHANMHGDKEMQGHMQEMQQTMQKIHQTKDADERMRLMQQHMVQMDAAMKELDQVEAAGGADPARAIHMHKHAQGMRQQMMEQMQVQQEELQRLHDHNSTKR